MHLKQMTVTKNGVGLVDYGGQCDIVLIRF